MGGQRDNKKLGWNACISIWQPTYAQSVTEGTLWLLVFSQWRGILWKRTTFSTYLPTLQQSSPASRLNLAVHINEGRYWSWLWQVSSHLSSLWSLPSHSTLFLAYELFSPLAAWFSCYSQLITVGSCHGPVSIGVVGHTTVIMAISGGIFKLKLCNLWHFHIILNTLFIYISFPDVGSFSLNVKWAI